ncbi:MAG: hypothetical protein AAF805_11475 [Planctomycetota bacterium]
MPNRIAINTLRRAHAALGGSFLAYLAYARPYVGPDDGVLEDAVRSAINELEGYSDRLARQVHRLGGETSPREFPAAYTDANDVGVRYALRRAANGLREDSAKLSALADELLDGDAEAVVTDTAGALGRLADRLIAVVRAADPHRGAAT